VTPAHAEGPREQEQERVVIRDNRKIDPVTGEARKGASPPKPADAPPEPAPERGQVPMVEAALLDERTADLQRVQAEYANYRKRAERDRLAAGDLATGRTLAELLPVLDDLDRAKAHGDVTGALKAVADKLDGVVAKLGLSAFGEVGDPFDPAIHEAVLHDESDDVTVPTCTTIMRQGYRYGERLLRAAMVGVSDPTAQPPSAGEPSVEAPVPDRDEAAETDRAEAADRRGDGDSDADPAAAPDATEG
jgi:molecular chaperone GrpE